MGGHLGSGLCFTGMSGIEETNAGKAYNQIISKECSGV
jgi:hypothetical protein